jgi:tungstate transport system substrate-binding protein
MNRISRMLYTLVACLVLSAVVSVSNVSAASKTLILATTTSTQDSGLLDVLIPMFEKQAGYFVKTISVGSGQAMKMGERGEADVLLVHSPEAEKTFVAQGFGVNRKLVMHNDFIILGPAKDPAKIRGSKTAAEAFKKIANSGSLFMSRGDNSGTHAKEKGLFKAAGITPDGQKWFQQTGLGMGETLSVAAEKQGYLLADRGTYLALNKKTRLGLDILVAGEPKLLNIYHVIEVNPAKWSSVNSAGAKAFSGFMVSKKAQDIISRFGIKEFGSPLFFPDAGKKPESLGL